MQMLIRNPSTDEAFLVATYENGCWALNCPEATCQGDSAEAFCAALTKFLKTEQPYGLHIETSFEYTGEDSK